MKLKFYMSYKDGSIVETTGHLLKNDLVAHRLEDNTWGISDYYSGCLVKGGLKSFKECQYAVEHLPDFILTSIKEVREKDAYKAQCQKVVDYAKGVDSKPKV